MAKESTMEYQQPCNLAVKSSTRIDGLEMSTEKLWLAVEHLQNRLPLWATILIGCLTGAIGWLAR